MGYGGGASLVCVCVVLGAGMDAFVSACMGVAACVCVGKDIDVGIYVLWKLVIC